MAILTVHRRRLHGLFNTLAMKRHAHLGPSRPGGRYALGVKYRRRKSRPPAEIGAKQILAPMTKVASSDVTAAKIARITLRSGHDLKLRACEASTKPHSALMISVIVEERTNQLHRLTMIDFHGLLRRGDKHRSLAAITAAIATGQSEIWLRRLSSECRSADGLLSTAYRQHDIVADIYAEEDFQSLMFFANIIATHAIAQAGGASRFDHRSSNDDTARSCGRH